MSDTSFTSDPGLPLPPKPPPAAPPKKSSKWVLFLLLLAATHFLVLIVSGGIGFGIGCAVTDRHATPDHDSLAVLPFTGEWSNPAGAKDDWADRRREFLQVTLPDALSREIAKESKGAVKVMATHDIRGRHNAQGSPRNLGREINVRAVLSGQVSKDGRLTLQLISVNSGELLWSNTYDLVTDQAGAPRWAQAGVEPVIARELRQKLVPR